MAEKLEELADRVIETDFLICGGGIVGSIAALRAKRTAKNVDVTVIDKATMEYSGDGVGLDNFNQVPLHKEDVDKKEVDTEEAKKAVFGADRLKGLSDLRLDAITMKNAYISQPILEDIGVKVREDDGSLKVLQGYRKGTVWGRIEYDENGKPIEPLFGSFSRGTSLKQKLGSAVRKSGTRVLDRTMLTSVITKDGKAVGATAINTRTGEFLVFKAKAVLLATGGAARLYPYPWGPYPNNLFYTLTSPVNDGGGHISALNAGATLYNMEMCIVYIVSKGMNHSSGGGACNWFFKMYNSKGEYLEDKYPDRVVTKAGGTIPGINFLYSPNMQNPEVEWDVIKSAKNDAEDDAVTAVYFTAATEPPKALKFHKLAGGLRNERPVECIPVPVGLGMFSAGVLRENERSETGVKNLFVAGNLAGKGGSAGFTWGCLIADHATELSQDARRESFTAEQVKQVKEAKTWVFAPMGREVRHKVNPLVLEDYVRNVNQNYVGIHRVKPKLERAVELIQFTRDGAVPQLSVKNPHNLMRAVEVRNIIDISEMHAQSALMRNESRLAPVHYRDDYPEQDPNWDNMVTKVRRIAGQLKYNKEQLNYLFGQMTAPPNACTMGLKSCQEVAVDDCSNTIPAPAGEILSAVSGPASGPEL